MEIKKAILNSLPAERENQQFERASNESSIAAEGISSIADSVENASKVLANPTLAPEWTDQNSHDPGIALVELFAYTADQLSYQQDKVAAEGYLQTDKDPDKKDP